MLKKIFIERNYLDKRLPWIDYAKAIAIILVVYRHIMIGLMRAGFEVPNYYVVANEMVYSFRMPLFFILSGLFLRRALAKKSNGEYVYNKFNSILYPYLIWTTIQVTIQVVFSSYINSDRSYMDYLYILIRPRAIDQFWFLYTLFNTSILYLLMFKIFRGNKILLVVTGIVFYLLAQYLNEYSLLQDALYYFVFVSIGDAASEIILSKNNEKYYSSWYTFFGILPFFILTQWYWLTHETHPLVFAVFALLGCAFIFNISFLLMRYEAAKVLRAVGFHSLQVYLLHVIVSAAVRTVMVKFMGIDEVTILLITGIIFGTIIPILVYQFCINNHLWLLFTLEKPKKRTKEKYEPSVN
ncbi:acyltransferase family protein [Fulvivirga ligni]|uniref:acyltransferase family protein n=1 Tax=Fulvivirga ligni TaxID=2904246 RepID=UPI001F4339B4|nr:acyltransferase [Fulvivirga ligni]UII19725.1 acyltransferase [Fulvivirga ligni]